MTLNYNFGDFWQKRALQILQRASHPRIMRYLEKKNGGKRPFSRHKNVKLKKTILRFWVKNVKNYLGELIPKFRDYRNVLKCHKLLNVSEK